MERKMLQEFLENAANGNGSAVSMRDRAFICYYFIKKGDYNKAEAFINSTAEEIRTGKVENSGMCYWLWILGELLNETKDADMAEKYADLIDLCINDISLNWDKPQKNWLGIPGDGIFISNIAIAHGALLSICNTVKNESAQKLILRMQGFLFEKFMDQGRVVSRLGDKDIYGDIGMIAVPFGLLDAGNQILLQSINFLENELMEKGVRFSAKDIYFGCCTRSDLTCLLSWYYSEKGNVPRAKWLLEQVDELWDNDGKLYVVNSASAREKLYYEYYLKNNGGVIDESFLSYALYAIAKQNVDIKEEMDAKGAEGVKILHNPQGTGNPYLHENKERCPNNPLKNDEVVLKMITQPFNSSQDVYAYYAVNGNEKGKVKMQTETSPEGEKYWKASLGTFDSNDKVQYSFEVDADNVKTESEKYSFTVREWRPIGNITNITNDGGVTGLYFESLNGLSKRPSIRIKRQDDMTLKLSFNMEHTQVDNGFIKDEINVDLESATFSFKPRDSSINIKNDIAETVLQSYYKHGKNFIELLTDDSGTVYKVRFNFLMDGEEKFFGMGERYSHIEYRGLEIDNCVYNQYRDQELRTYFPVPYAMSSKGYGIYLDTTMYSVFRFGTRLSDLLEIEADIQKNRQNTDVFFLVGSPKDMVKSFVKITGKPEMPPKWVFGPWMSSHNWDNQAETCKQVELTKQYEIPATVIVLEQWSDEATMYIFNDAQYQVKDGNDYLKYEDFTFPEWGRWPDPKQMADYLHSEGIKLILWQVPIEKFMDGIAHAQKDEDERVMLEKGYNVKYEDGKPYRIPTNEWFKRSLIPDFSNAEAKEWWMNRRLYLVNDIGVDGFKTDGGECIYGEDMVFHDGRTGAEMRNQYINDYVESYHQFTKEHVDDGGITFSRSGYTGAQKFPLHWAGDNRSTFNTYKSSVKAGLSCSMSGIPFWGWDIGGFHGEIPTAELYIRSTQMAALCPIMQYHAETKGELNRDRTPWNIAERTGTPAVLDICKKYTDLRMNLMPYIYSQAIESSKTGIPMMRAMFLEYPDDTSCIGLDAQYFFGDSLLVAPVVEEGSNTKDVYLPKGSWYDFYTGEKLEGSRFMNVKADIDHIPVYVKEDNIIPLNLNDDCKLFGHVGNRLDSYKNLCFMALINGIGTYSFEDDMSNRINIDYVRRGKKLKLDIGSNYGDSFAIIIRDIKSVKTVLLDGCRISDEQYAIDGQDLIVKLDGRNGKSAFNLEVIED